MTKWDEHDPLFNNMSLLEKKELKTLKERKRRRKEHKKIKKKKRKRRLPLHTEIQERLS